MLATSKKCNGAAGRAFHADRGKQGVQLESNIAASDINLSDELIRQLTADDKLLILRPPLNAMSIQLLARICNLRSGFRYALQRTVS